jgi:hypothetical protein
VTGALLGGAALNDIDEATMLLRAAMGDCAAPGSGSMGGTIS